MLANDVHYPLDYGTVMPMVCYLDRAQRTPIVPVAINCYGRRVISQRGGFPNFDRQLDEGDFDPPAPTGDSPALAVTIDTVAPPVLHAALARAMSAKRLFNVTITNIPGSPRRLYAFGAPMVDLVPIVPLAAERDDHPQHRVVPRLGDEPVDLALVYRPQRRVDQQRQ